MPLNTEKHTLITRTYIRAPKSSEQTSAGPVPHLGEGARKGDWTLKFGPINQSRIWHSSCITLRNSLSLQKTLGKKRFFNFLYITNMSLLLYANLKSFMYETCSL
jgi:hypothetical protein